MLSPARIGPSTCQGTGLTETWHVTVVLEGQLRLGRFFSASHRGERSCLLPWHMPLGFWEPCGATFLVLHWEAFATGDFMEIQKHADLLCWKLGMLPIVRFIRRSYIFTAIFAATNQHSNGISFCGPNGRLNAHFAVIKSMSLDNVTFLASHETVSVWSVGCRAPTWLQHVHKYSVS